MPKPRLLIVDDEETLREGLRTYLELEGFDVDVAISAEDVLKLDVSSYDLLVLDIMLDGMSGTDLAHILKNNPLWSHVPVIFLSARDSDDDMVAGLRLGADDYIAKPFSMKNVVARIEAVLRRSGNKPKASGIVCDRNSMSSFIDGQEVKFPKKEFEILALLLENPGRIFSREELLKRVWPENVVVTDRSVDVHITRIRNKISPYSRKIVSRSGYGYGWID